MHTGPKRFTHIRIYTRTLTFTPCTLHFLSRRLLLFTIAVVFVLEINCQAWLKGAAAASATGGGGVEKRQGAAAAK